MNTNNVKVCPACGMPANGKTVSSLWSLIQCSACTHVFATRFPDNRRFEAVDYVAWRSQANAEFTETARRRYATVQTQMPEYRGRVLELGCSTGEVLAEFSRNGWQAFGSDFSKAAIQTARQRYPQIEFCIADENEILKQEGENAFDLILAFHVIEHVPNIERLIGALRRLCKPNGHLYLAFPYWGAWSRKVFGDAWPDFASEHLHFFTRESMQKWLQRGGFELVQTASWGRAWQWLGGVKRVVRGTGPNVSAAPINGEAPAMPSNRRHTIIRVTEKLARPFLMLEEFRGAGSELAIIARKLES